MDMALTSCSLCSFACEEYKCLYDANGGASEVYEVVIKYFHSSLLNNAKTKSSTKAICLECWRHISDFHNFQQWILNARTDDLKFVIKEEDLSEQSNDAIKSNESTSTPSGCSDYESFTKEISMFECENCKELFQSDKALVAHLKSCQENKNSNEELNAKHNSFESKIVKIINIRDKNAFKCETCEASFSQYGNLRRHIRKQHATQPLLKYVCKYCNKLFKKKTLLEMHKNKIHKKQSSDKKQSAAKQVVADKENSAKCSDTYQDSKTSCDPKLATDQVCEDKFLVLEMGDGSMSAENDTKPQIHKPTLEIIDIKKEVSTDEEVTDDEMNNVGNSDEKVDNELELQYVYLECPRCSQLVKNYTQLKEHFDVEHPDERCYINCCHLTLYEAQAISEHLEYHKNPSAFKCTECGKCFKGKKGLGSHKLQVHGDSRSRYHLHLCCCKTGEERHKENLAKGQQLEYDTRVCCQRKKKILEDDQLIAKWRKELTCEICKTNFPYYSWMRSHSYYKHPGEKCYISCCQRKMSRISDTLEHIRFHLNPHLYRCEKCNVDFSGKSTLAKHMRNAHTDLLPKHRWACDECDKTFEIRQILTRHKNVCHSKKKV